MAGALTDTRKTEIAHAAAKILLDTRCVLLNAQKPFTYTSGKIGPVYVDCRRLMSFPDARSALMDFAAEILDDGEFDYIAGGETAGIPYAAFIAERLKKPMLYVRKKPKGFGRMAQIEGYMEEKNARVALVEDLQNFGTSVRTFVEALRAAGARVQDFFVIFSYGHESALKNLRNMDVRLHALATWRDILDVAREDQYFDEETIASVEAYLDDPDGWAEKNRNKAENPS